MRSLVVGLCLATLAVGVPACVQPQSVYCASGRVCPTGRVCDDVHDRCVQPDQLTSCTDLGEDMPCAIGGELVGICSDGVCVEVSCGDGVVSGLEDCDGSALDVTECTQLGYYESGPVSCTAACRYDDSACTRVCGDGIVDPEEQCDSVAPPDRDDCTEHGFYQPGAVECRSCRLDVSTCAGRCGDGIRNGNEVCDGSHGPLLACTDFGFDRGRLGCQSCGADLASCDHIGWTALAALGTADWQGAWSAGSDHVIVVGTGGAVIEVTGTQSTQGTIANGGQTLLDVWGPSTNDVFAVDTLGGIWRRGSGGWVASRAQADASAGLHAITGTSASDVWAVGSQERILHFDGASWTQVRASTGTLNDLWVDASGNGIAVGNAGLILRRSGTSWTPETSGTTQNLTAVWSDGVTAFAVGAGGTILRHDGQIWTPMTSPVGGNLSALYGRSHRDLYAAGPGGTILHFDGASWWPLESRTSTNLATVTGNASTTYVAGRVGTLLASEASWARPAIPGSGGLWGHVSIAGDAIVAATRGSCSLYRRTEAAWTAISETCTQGSFSEWDAVWVAPTGEIFAAEDDGIVHRSSADGQTWSVDAPVLGTDDISALWGTSANDVWAVGLFDSTIAHWNGTSWTTSTPTDERFAGIGGSSPVDVYAVGWEVWRWNGTSWSDLTPPGFAFWNDVWAAGPNDVWVVGNEGKLMHRDASGWTQWPSNTAVALKKIAGSASHDLWAVGDSGTILHFDGVAWTSIATPVTADFFDIAVREDVVVLAAWDDGLITLVREETAW